MIENIGLTKIGTELAAVADRLRAITVKVRSGNLGIGAGTIWRSDGLIITNAHVATRSRSIVDGLAVAIPIAKVAGLLRGRDRRAPGLV
jgi:hypothetical protein